MNQNKFQPTPPKNWKHAVEPPRKRPPKMRRLVVANGRWSLTRIEPQEVSLRRKLNTSTLRRIIYCMQFPSYGMCSSMLLLFLPQEIRKLVGWSLKRGWKQCKIIKQSAPISGRGCLQERFQLEDLPGWVLVFWIGGRTWAGVSTVLQQSESPFTTMRLGFVHGR